MQLAQVHQVARIVRRLAPHAGRSVTAVRRPIMSSSTCQATQPKVAEVYLDKGDADPEITGFQKSQEAAPRPTAAQDARTWMALARTGVLSTVPAGPEPYPQSSVVEFVTDAAGKPIFVVSTLSAHTADLGSTGRMALTVTSPGFKTLQDGRFTLQGRVRSVASGSPEHSALREMYLAKYPEAFWVDFPDFRMYIVDEIKAVRHNGGFATAQKVTAEQYSAAQPDPVAAFAGPVCGHMNADHQQDMLAMVAHLTGLTGVESVTLTGLDRLGLGAQLKRKGESFRARLPFPRPAEDRKAVKEVIVEMTKAARAAAAAKAKQEPAQGSSA